MAFQVGAGNGLTTVSMSLDGKVHFDLFGRSKNGNLKPIWWNDSWNFRHLIDSFYFAPIYLPDNEYHDRDDRKT